MGVDIPELGGVPTRTGGVFGLSLRRRAATIGLFLALFWMVWLIDDLLLHGTLAQYGVVPRTMHGLLGIIFAPFLHASWSHISSNTLGVLMLGGLLILRNEEAFWVVSILGALTAGVGTWLIGRGNAVHIGASGVIFAYFGYLLFAGIFERRIGSLLLSVLVFLIWGGMLWSTVPSYGAGMISWEGHLCGLAGGIMAAKLLTQRKTAKE